MPLAFLISDLSESERVARLRELRVLVMVYCGADHPATTALSRRRLLASYAALHA
jgi:hypothetical protein